MFAKKIYGKAFGLIKKDNAEKNCPPALSFKYLMVRPLLSCLAGIIIIFYYKESSII